MPAPRKSIFKKKGAPAGSVQGFDPAMMASQLQALRAQPGMYGPFAPAGPAGMATAQASLTGDPSTDLREQQLLALQIARGQGAVLPPDNAAAYNALAGQMGTSPYVPAAQARGADVREWISGAATDVYDDVLKPVGGAIAEGAGAVNDFFKGLFGPLLAPFPEQEKKAPAKKKGPSTPVPTGNAGKSSNKGTFNTNAAGTMSRLPA